MPDSIKAISPILETASAREHATAHFIWRVNDGKAKHHVPPERKTARHKSEGEHHDQDAPSDPDIHHIDILV